MILRTIGALWCVWQRTVEEVSSADLCLFRRRCRIAPYGAAPHICAWRTGWGCPSLQQLVLHFCLPVAGDAPAVQGPWGDRALLQLKSRELKRTATATLLSPALCSRGFHPPFCISEWQQWL